MSDESERLLDDAHRRAQAYRASLPQRAVFPAPAALQALEALDEALPDAGHGAAATLALLDAVGSPATVASAGPRYFGFVIGGTLPVAAAAEELALAWDQCASSPVNSPAAAALERVAARWVLEILDLPRESAVSFGTSATAGTFSCLATGRRALLARAGWDSDERGLFGATALGGLGGVAFGSQLAGTALGIAVALTGGAIVYGTLKATVGLRLDPEEEFNGADLTIHKISATAERETAW